MAFIVGLSREILTPIFKREDDFKWRLIAGKLEISLNADWTKNMLKRRHTGTSFSCSKYEKDSATFKRSWGSTGLLFNPIPTRLFCAPKTTALYLSDSHPLSVNLAYNCQNNSSPQLKALLRYLRKCTWGEGHNVPPPPPPVGIGLIKVVIWNPHAWKNILHF